MYNRRREIENTQYNTIQYNVKLTKQVQNPPDAPPAAKDSNGNDKTPSTPPPPPADSNADVMKALNSSTFLDNLVDQLVLRLATRKTEQEMKGKKEVLVFQLNDR